MAMTCAFLFAAQFHGVFADTCEREVKCVFAKHLAYFFLKLEEWYGDNVEVCT